MPIVLDGDLVLSVCLDGDMDTTNQIEGEYGDIQYYSDYPIYPGATTVTPTRETQVLNTNGYLMNNNVTVEPIPWYYGLITWNGSVLTVS